jgi:hypothetical protein
VVTEEAVDAGEERRQRAMLMLIDPEKRLAKTHPLRRGKQLPEEPLGPAFASILGATAIYFAQAPVESLAADGAVYDYKRAAVVGQVIP